MKTFVRKSPQDWTVRGHFQEAKEGTADSSPVFSNQGVFLSNTVPCCTFFISTSLF